jgi:Fuc2NAc and GlcNAc transferase
MKTELALIGIGCFVVSAGTTELYRRYAVRKGIVDVPNSRSSHTVPTPRGGGVGILVAMTLALGWMGYRGSLPPSTALGLFISGALVGLVGFLDDRGNLRRRIRFAAHILAAVVLLVVIRPLPRIEFGSRFAITGSILPVLYLLYIVTSINLTNFMDGIDGIAGSYAASVCVTGAACTTIAHGFAEPDLFAIALAASALGFLLWNWPPARIFLGDVGSGYLGIMLAAASLLSSKGDAPLIWSWLILMGTFMVDGSVTLVTRLLRGERIYDAHRTHAYQRAAGRLKAHRPVAVIYVALTIFWLFPLALLVASARTTGGTTLIVAYAPLVLGALLIGAGRESGR